MWFGDPPSDVLLPMWQKRNKKQNEKKTLRFCFSMPTEYKYIISVSVIVAQ